MPHCVIQLSLGAVAGTGLRLWAGTRLIALGARMLRQRIEWVK